MVCQQHKELVEKIINIEKESEVMNAEIKFIKEQIKKTEQDIEYLRIEISKLKSEISAMPIKITMFVGTIVGIINSLLFLFLKIKGG